MKWCEGFFVMSGIIRKHMLNMCRKGGISCTPLKSLQNVVAKVTGIV